MPLNLEALTAEVQRAQTVQFSAVTLLKRLTEELETIHATLDASNTADAAPLGALIEKLKESTDGLAAAVSDSTDKLAPKEVVLNAEDPTAPTIQVIMPEVLPENVEVKAEQIVDVVDPTSTEPQIVVTVTEAPAPVDAPAPEASVVTEVIETAPTQVDVTMTADAAVVEEIKVDAGVDIMAAVQDAVAEAEVQAVEAPVVSTILNAEDPTVPTVQVVTPEVLPADVVVTAEQVVDVIDPTSTEPQVVVHVEAAPVDAPAPAVEPVVAVIETPEEQTNVTVSVPADVQEAILTDTGVDVAAAVQEAVAVAETPAEPAVEAAPDAPPAP